ncbi:MAG: hypothetical protein SFY67_10765 [Candidatus Melainabacteria bacterium]|nr:hypothetical protein [Candidatus Melainabacteria bacterium]
MSPFNPDKFRLDSTSQGGVNSSIDRKIEKLSKKCAELIQKNKHKDAKKILSEIKELKALRLPEDDSVSNDKAIAELEKTVVTTPMLQIPDSAQRFPDQEKTLATTPLVLDDQEKTVVSPAQEVQKIPEELDKTVVTMPFHPEQNFPAQNNVQQTSPLQNVEDQVLNQTKESKNRSTIFGIGACILTFFVMALFSFLAFKDFPGQGNYFDWLRAESVYQKAESERNAGSFDQAITSYLEANKIYPDLAKAADARGSVQLIKEQNKEALSSFKDAALSNPKNSRFQRDYAYALALNDEEVKATEIVTKLDTKESGATQNKALLALLQLKSKQSDADSTISQALAKSNDANAERDFYAGLFYRLKGDLARSQECFKRATTAEPLNVLALLELIKTKEMQNEDATKETNDLTKLAPNWVGAWHMNAKQNESQKKFSEAAENYAKAAKLEPNNSDRFSRAAQAYLQAGKKQDAIKYAQDGLKIRTADFNCLDVISKADENANPLKMEDLYRKALSENEDYAPGWSGLALWQSKQEGKSLEALESQAKALKLDQKDAESWYQLALFLESFNNRKEAQRAAAEAMSLAPENEKYTELRMKLMASD